MKKFTKVITVVAVMLLGIFGLVACASDEKPAEEAKSTKWCSSITNRCYTFAKIDEFGNLNRENWQGGKGQINTANKDLDLQSGTMTNDKWIDQPYGYFEVRFKNVGEGKFTFGVEQGGLDIQISAELESVNLSVNGVNQVVDITKSSDVALANEWHSFGIEWCGPHKAKVEDKAVDKAASLVVYFDAEKVYELEGEQLLGGEGAGAISMSMDNKSNDANKVSLDYVVSYTFDKDSAQ